MAYSDNVLSKVQVGSITYDLKDAEAYRIASGLLGDNTLAALQSAAWKAAQTTWNAETEHAGELPTTAAVKSYVDAQVGAIHKFDVVIADSLPTASENTMYKLYLIPKTGGAGTNVKEEWITIRSGAEGSYTYAWEKIGDTEVDLSNYVQKTTTIAGIDLQDDITQSELQQALGLDALAYKASASGEYTPVGVIDSIDLTPAGEVYVELAQVPATASLDWGDFTPAGDVYVELTQAPTDITSTGSIVPSGTIVAKESGSINALTEATFIQDNNGVQIGGTNASSAVSFTGGTTTSALTGIKTAAVAPSFTEGAFTAASLESGFYTAGSAATWTGATYSAPSLGAASSDVFAKEGMTATVSSETLVFATASTANAITAQGTFTTGNVDFGTFNGGSATVIDVTKFKGGSKASDTFTAGSAAEFNSADVVTSIGTGTAAAQTFTGNKYGIGTSFDTALKSVEFAGDSCLVTVSGQYNQASVSSATFLGATQSSVLVTSVMYDQATVSSATFMGTMSSVTPYFTGETTTIIVE